MVKRRIIILKVVILSLVAAFCISCGGHQDGGSETSATQTAPSDSTFTQTERAEDPVVVIVDNATGEILGVKVNEVGDYFIINPGNEEIIPMEGHSQVVLEN